ncbi:nicotianamine synthase family protein [Paenibacillus antri]|nr:nicotianamine synthase family protein [Paenibacillus antri]
MYGHSEALHNPKVAGKYELLLGIKTLDYEIKELTRFSKSCCECYSLLKERIDKLCRFMTDEDNENLWLLYGFHDDVRAHAQRLRESSAQAVCDMEKYHSLCLCDEGRTIFEYLSTLSDSVKEEFVRCRIDETSNVLFIGSGAFPLSALTIAKETGASVLGLDIDTEAVRLSNKIAEASGLRENVRFSGVRIREIDSIREVTHVIIASLVPQKKELLDELKSIVDPNAKIIVRYGNGLKSVFNYPMEGVPDDAWIPRELPSCGKLYDAVLFSQK